MQERKTNITKVFLTKLLKYGAGPFIFSIALVVGLVIVNYVFAAKTTSIDVTANKVNTLTERSQMMTADIDFPVTIRAFYTDGSEARIRELLNKYRAVNNNLTIEFIDPIKNPLVAEEYDVNEPRTIVMEGRGNTSRVEPPTGYQPTGEREVSLALFRLLSNETNKLYFTIGHGEMSLSNTRQDGINIVEQRLREQNFVVEEINILEAGAIPEDCTALVIVAPKVPFTDEEETIVAEYAMDEGALLLMNAPGIDPNLDLVTRQYAIEFGDNYVYETSSRYTSASMGGAVSPFCIPQEEHEITEPLENQTFLFPYVRSVEIARVSDLLRPTRLVASSEHSWAETDLASARAANTNNRPSRDDNEKKGPITVAVAVERDYMLPDSLVTVTIDRLTARSAFFGNGAFIANRFVTPLPSNLNLFLNTINWITQNEKVIEILPNINRFTPVELTGANRRLITWLTVVIFPASILLVGFVVWFRRR